MELVTKIIELIKEKKLTISTCESASCGTLASTIGSISGVSSIYMGGIISYSNNAKINIVGVNKETINDYGAISEQTAKEMCLNTNKKFQTDLCISITGNAGPNPSENKPVGEFYVGIAIKDFAITKKITTESNNRDYNRFEIALESLLFLQEILLKV